MPYTVPTFAQAKTALAARLNDASKVHWIDDELGVYLKEALRTWNAWTSHWRELGTFNTDGSAFYDLAAVLPTLRALTVTNHDVVEAIQYHLLEPPTPTAWTGTAQFTLAQVSQAIQRRRDQFLLATGAILTRSVTNYQGASLPANGQIALDESVLRVHRAAWRPTATQLLLPLRRTDEWGGDHFLSTWRTPAPPKGYSVSATPPLTLQLMPPASAAGDLDLISISRGNQFANPSLSALLGVPDDWAWVVKFGALADLLNSDGLALDPARAAYCEARWQQGVSMAQSAAVVLSATLGGAAAMIGSLADADSYAPTWQLIGGAPLRLVLTGQNLLATAPPAAGAVAVGLEVVRNAPVPAADVGVLQVGADLYDTILDLAQHLAAFKDGPGQLELAQPLLQRAGSVAGVNLAVQQATQPNRSAMAEITRTDTLAAPQQAPPVEVP